MANEPIIDTSTTYNIDYTTDDIVNAWQTQRLRMIRIEPGDMHVRKALAVLQQDPVVTALASSAALQPVGGPDLDFAIGAISQAQLGVAVALLPTEPEAASSDKPVIVGNMTLGWGGLSARTAHHRTASVGITLARQWQGRGYGAEAMGWLLDWAFAHAGLHTVSLTAAAFNQRAIGMYKKVGFRVEGRHKERIFFNHGWHDEIAFGITEDEWALLRGRK
ncbi:Acyl-CoA N-acyltransferase [Cordyceps fumosorosea ARSEF 2679]|uniref:Acyl-CoA N-acyltransferase n=1 Tax=Cordyceps fumosorosea (strain ARSEF 2679) TaxID=1081104 RepID=A0A167SY52_CORFA|nr:Acyl-CoA N-acyltransferase [Cordyceps fumosorosea ARSEF 2679]OAA60054.1 Acyl-CoA N-acyltransferase [Cordyceps fumosorosea ARSEF 2679]